MAAATTSTRLQLPDIFWLYGGCGELGITPALVHNRSLVLRARRFLKHYLGVALAHECEGLGQFGTVGVLAAGTVVNGGVQLARIEPLVS